MAEGGIPTSQESLPLSQETYRQLFTQLIEDSFPGVSESYNETIPIPDEFLNVPLEELSNSIGSSSSLPVRPPSSLPASENWAGDFDFRISFRNYENIKGVNWVFAKDRNKLFVARGAPCPIQFSTSTLMTNDVTIRAMALFSSSEHSTDVVTRCVNHSMPEIERGIFEAEHLIRCEAASAVYVTDPVTKRHSVVIPYENPAVGEQFSSYLFKFMCFGSCSGGPNRRPLMLVFTLERGGYVIGRQKVDLKICACPVRDYRGEEKMLFPPENKGVLVPKPRDYRSEEKMLFPPQKKVLVPKPRNQPNQNISDCNPEAFLNYSQMETETEAERNRGEPYIIKVWNKPCYDFLKGMKRLFRAYVLVTKKYPKPEDLCNVFSSMSSRSD